MGLDTRGFMDGALRGYDLMDRHYARERQNKLTDERMEMQRENNALRQASMEQQMSLRDIEAKRADEDYDRKYGTVSEDGKRTGGTYQEDRELAKKQAKQNANLRNAQIESAKASADNSKYQMEQAKKANEIQQKLPLIQAGWKEWGKSEEVPEVFNNKYIKGSAYDPRRYMEKDINDAFTTLQEKLPQIIKNKDAMNDPEFVSALGVMYKNQVRGVIGQIDPITGKKIKDAKLGGVHLAKDIDPNQPGDQPGVVLTTLVNYGDGKWIPKPISNSRSTDQNDGVKVIPLASAMRDITSQLGMWRQASKSQAYKSIFKPDKADAKNQAAYRDKAAEIEKERLQAIGKLDASLGEEGYKTQVEQINRTAEEAKNNLKRLYSGEIQGKTSEVESQPGTSVPAWANGDPNKIKFAEFLQSQGENVEAMSAKQLNDEYADYSGHLKRQEDEKRAQEIIDNNAMITRDSKGNPTYSDIPVQ